MEGTSREMPKYKCHKEVWALKIKSVELVESKLPHNTQYDGAIITPEDERYSAFRVDENYRSKHNPQAGGYFVVYKGGYESWSPASDFEDGYAPIIYQVSNSEVNTLKTDFSWALSKLKSGKKLTRTGWKDTCFIEAQFPDENSKMTKPYLFMTKGEHKFPCDLSCESIFADDWKIVE